MGGIELALHPNHLGDVVFSSVFSSPAEDAIQAAIQRAMEECLPANDRRKPWPDSGYISP
jgi:hypothetical protein